MAGEGRTALRRGWTTGACGAAAARAAYTALVTGRFPDSVSLRLPHGGSASFPLALAERDEALARAGITKDAGDDPDVTHGALIMAETEWAPSGAGIGFAAGEGEGRLTRAGLSLAIDEPGDQSGAARDDPDMLIERRRTMASQLPMSLSRFRFPAASAWPRRR
jgi:cobalt-precorrin-5B (C1)-methyltransferase